MDGDRDVTQTARPMSLSRVLAPFRVPVAAALLVVTAACDPVLSERRVQDVVVGPEMLPCFGVGPQMCLYVRPYGSPGWEYFYGEIEGFAYEPGFEYVIRIERTTVRNPPADGSIYRFRLIDVIKKTPVPADGA